ncbi:hypothetical protein QU481_02885 [Crenobacter sp. SG2303]|uniref:Uncharacterized protein n=1 Tax=Crenobacter oryzisoli TaxID=3056844 RepID=A0ABT7XJ69_9NEIS|nr:hypothetical protein [Crenobacter sp. SG2303]MDN0073836.1 hypothetical protein [Crenobacter sp. SG2303]
MALVFYDGECHAILRVEASCSWAAEGVGRRMDDRLAMFWLLSGLEAFVVFVAQQQTGQHQ